MEVIEEDDGMEAVEVVTTINEEVSVSSSNINDDILSKLNSFTVI